MRQPYCQSGNFSFFKTPIEGVVVIEARRFVDERGYFRELYKRPDFIAGGISDVFVQENQSLSKYGVLRGLHFQKQYPQSKLVRVLAGEAFDVAVDLRKDSPSFGVWFGAELSADNGRQLYLPRGCAHGILMLSEQVIFSYMADDIYHPDDEGAVRWNDPDVAVKWPLPSTEVIVSAKDSYQPHLSEQFML